MWRVVSLALFGVLFLMLALAGSSLRPAPVETVSLFNRRCAACHGKDGSLFEERFEQKYPNSAELKEMVKTMPGAIGLTNDELDPLVAYMRAISRREVYIIWTRENNGRLEGEISSPNATLRASAKRQSLKVERTGTHGWRLQLPKGIEPKDVELEAQYRDKRIKLRLKDAPYTHAKP
jgi:hypothetical protein